MRLALLTAALKLFFARPPECQALLGAALAAAAADANQDVRDRGLMYYRRADSSRTGSLPCMKRPVSLHTSWKTTFTLGCCFLDFVEHAVACTSPLVVGCGVRFGCRMARCLAW